MHVRLAALLLALLVVAAVPTAQAGSRTQAYNGGGVDAFYFAFFSASEPTPFTPVGGAAFAPDGLTPRAVSVADATGRAVSILVCQDLDRDLVCDASEPRSYHCGRSATLPPTVFAADKWTVVFVGSGICDDDTTSAVTTATRGAITLVTG